MDVALVISPEVNTKDQEKDVKVILVGVVSGGVLSSA